MPTYQHRCPEHGDFEVFFVPHAASRPCPTCEAPSPNIPALRNISTDSGFRGGRWHPTIGNYNSRKEFAEKTAASGHYNMDDFGSKDAFSRYCKARKQERIDKQMKKLDEGLAQMAQEHTLDELQKLADNNNKLGPSFAITQKAPPEGVGKVVNGVK